MINYCGFYKTASKNRLDFNQKQGMSLESLANKNDRDCIKCSKSYGYETISNVSYMSRLKEISESQLIGNK